MQTVHAVCMAGAADAPNYGDFEAQRHWMEITLSTPVTEWCVACWRPNWPLL